MPKTRSRTSATPSKTNTPQPAIDSEVSVRHHILESYSAKALSVSEPFPHVSLSKPRMARNPMALSR